jgi:FAD:protein FMN transferase
VTQKHEFRAMGSRMLGIVDTDEACPALQELPLTFEAWEQALSRFRSDSELCELNRRAGSAVVVSQVLWEVFEAAREAETETRGLINPLIGNALVEAGYNRSFDELQLRDDLSRLPLNGHPTPILADIRVDMQEHTLRLPAGSRLDLGGVAKGWAAQQAMLALSAYGPTLFSAGGDIAVSGLRIDGEPWEIDVEDPFQPGEYIDQIRLGWGGVATSGKDYRHWMRGGASQHHIIDPRTGLPAVTDVLTATVIAPDVITAEAFAKAVLMSGSAAGMAWLDSDDRLAGLLVLDNGQRLDSRNLDAYL